MRLTRPCGAGTAGGEAQLNDIKALRREIELKKTKLNELKEETKRCAAAGAVLSLSTTWTSQQARSTW